MYIDTNAKYFYSIRFNNFIFPFGLESSPYLHPNAIINVLLILTSVWINLVFRLDLKVHHVTCTYKIDVWEWLIAVQYSTVINIVYLVSCILYLVSCILYEIDGGSMETLQRDYELNCSAMYKLGINRSNIFSSITEKKIFDW